MNKKITISCLTLMLTLMAAGSTQVRANITENEEIQVVLPMENTDSTEYQESIESSEEIPEETPLEQDILNWQSSKLNATYIKRAKNTTYQLKIESIPVETSDYTIVWKSDRKRVATVDNHGNVTVLKAGNAVITATVRTEAGHQKIFQCEVAATNPKFDQSTYTISKGNTLQLGMQGTDTVNYKMSSSDEYLLKAYSKQSGLIKGKRVGEVVVWAEVDGAVIQCKVIVTNPKIKKKLFVLEKNKTDSIQVTDQSTQSKVTYVSKNPKIAGVSSKGTITTYRTGVAVIVVTVDQKEFEITVSVGNTRAVAAIKNARRALGATYSQMYRMRPGYYDCSSLIWRCYRPTGLTFGYSKYASNAPTAAGEAYYLDTHNKAIAHSYVDEKNLKPGDVVFISSGYNGRYKNITHVVMYIGNDIIIHATPSNGNCVQYGSYVRYKDMIVGIGRPTM